jgi:arylsulfatase A-like enzyme
MAEAREREASFTAQEWSPFWPSVWLAVFLVAPKVAVFGVRDLFEGHWLRYAGELCAVVHEDLFFGLFLGLFCAAVLRPARRRPRAAQAVRAGFFAACWASALYAIVGAYAFTYIQTPITYSALALATDLRALRSSVAGVVSLPLVFALAAAPALHAALSAISPQGPGSRRARAAAACAVFAAAFTGAIEARGAWRWRQDARLAESPHLVLLRTSVAEILGRSAVRLDCGFLPADLEDFVAIARRAPQAAPFSPPARPRNVILLVLESVPKRLVSVYGSKYDATPNLRAEAAHALVFDNYYAHAAQSTKALFSILLSRHTGFGWRDPTVERTDEPGETLPAMLKARGYRTAYLHDGDLSFASQRRFLEHRGFDRIGDIDDLGGKMLTSWGGEDRLLIDGMLRFIDEDRTRPFFLMAWTIQTHHPYEPSPGQTIADFFGEEKPPDAYDLGRYLNCLCELDREIGRLFSGLRARGLAEDTLVVLVGDHGEAFGDPHETWGHGATVYEEHVHVPLLLWNPRLFEGGRRSAAIGGHVDLSPTIAEIMGLPPAPSWRGRSLLDPQRPPRTYFFSSLFEYRLGVREGSLKYIFNVTLGTEELYDLSCDPDERENLAARDVQACARLRRRLAAWVASEQDEGPAALAETHGP